LKAVQKLKKGWWHMAEEKTFVLKVPVTTVVDKPVGYVPITDFFDEEDRVRGYTTGHKLVAKGLATDTAQEDSQFAKEQGIPAGVDYMLFVGKDLVWYVYRDSGRLYRIDCSLAVEFRDGYWVARPRK
jgi:hypothetical protein